MCISNYLDERKLFTRNSESIDGNADALIVIGKLIKMGYNCSRVDVSISKYDAVIDGGILLRIQIKATNTDSLSLTCGARSG